MITSLHLTHSLHSLHFTFTINLGESYHICYRLLTWGSRTLYLATVDQGSRRSAAKSERGWDPTGFSHTAVATRLVRARALRALACEDWKRLLPTDFPHTALANEWKRLELSWLRQPPARVHRLSAFTAVGTATAAEAGPLGWGSTFKKNDKK